MDWSIYLEYDASCYNGLWHAMSTVNLPTSLIGPNDKLLNLTLKGSISQSNHELLQSKQIENISTTGDAILKKIDWAWNIFTN